MINHNRRKRVLCIRPRLHPDAGPILTITSNEWVEALALHAEVRSVEEDFDLDAVCKEFRPDLIVVDAINFTRSWALAIAHPRAHPQIPRLLFLNSDPHDPMRALTMRWAEELGCEAVFVTGEAYRQHMPELRHLPCFFAPQFIDDRIYHEYGLAKIIPVSVFGGHMLPSFYAWRAQLLDEVPRVFPTLIYTHPGYLKGHKDPFAVRDEAYARLLAQSHFSAADTTRLDYGVRKHLEIPASGAVLIAPRSDALASYGFVDMQNCLLGSGAELFEKMALVARSPENYESLRRAGQSLVLTRYTRRNWRLMLDWLDCRTALQPGETVQQVGRYGPFRAVAPSASTPSVAAPVQADSDMAGALRLARAAILSGQGLEAAEAALTEAIGWVWHIAEPLFLLGMVALLKGEPAEAGKAMVRRAKSCAKDGEVGLLDPVETAWLRVIGWLTGDGDLERVARAQAATVSHVSLRRALALVDGPAAPQVSLNQRQAGDVISVHWLGDDDFAVWSDLIRRVLLANQPGRLDCIPLAERLTTAA